MMPLPGPLLPTFLSRGTHWASCTLHRGPGSTSLCTDVGLVFGGSASRGSCSPPGPVASLNKCSWGGSPSSLLLVSPGL